MTDRKESDAIADETSATSPSQIAWEAWCFAAARPDLDECAPSTLREVFETWWRARQAAPHHITFADPRSDLLRRLALLKATQRPGEPLTDRDGPTVAGHIASAITKIERQLEAMRLEKP